MICHPKLPFAILTYKIMSKKIILILFIVVTTYLIFVTGCYKVTTVKIENQPEITEPVSFSNDIIPIFNESCNMSGCHSSGGTNPDLTADKAYNSLIDGNYVNLEEPENSELYLWLTGKRALPMPVGGPNNPSNINQLVLAWIKQGAENN
jgi:hypothetical protein